MTEDEARTKWCPHARIEGDGRNMEIVNGHTVPAVFCIGSACMAWRTVPKIYEAPDGTLRDREDGFCGLAGMPA